MKLKKYIAQGLVAMMLGAGLYLPMTTAAAEETPDTAIEAAETEGATVKPIVSASADTKKASAAKDAKNAKDEDKIIQVNLTYKYTSSRYGYTIMCPKKPVGVIPLSVVDESSKGDVLVFASEGMNIIKAWIVAINAYTDEEVPANIGSLTDQQKQEIIKKFNDKYGFSFARVVQIGDKTFGMYGITAKEIDVDTNGDGKPDTVAVANNQMVKAYIPGEFGGHFAIGLLDNPQLSKEGIAFFNAGLATFQQWPTSGYQQAKEQAAADKKDPKKKKKTK